MGGREGTNCQPVTLKTMQLELLLPKPVNNTKPQQWLRGGGDKGRLRPVASRTPTHLSRQPCEPAPWAHLTVEDRERNRVGTWSPRAVICASLSQKQRLGECGSNVESPLAGSPLPA